MIFAEIGWQVWVLVGVAVVAPILFFMLNYNKLVTLRNRLRNAFSQIDVQLKRRYDLVPNLVEAVKGYMTHERETLENVIRARNEAMSATQAAAAHPESAAAIGRVVGAENTLTQWLGRIMMRVEAYPELKASQNVLALQEELVSTENRIAYARQAYNDAVMRYNTTCEKVPTNVVAGMFGFERAQMFEVETATERAAVKVSF